jgi:hypothetical protein
VYPKSSKLRSEKHARFSHCTDSRFSANNFNNHCHQRRQYQRTTTCTLQARHTLPTNDTQTMIFRRSTILSFVAGLLLSATACHAQNRENALKDMHIGMQGLQQAGEDPAMLAQLMQDMQVRRLGLTSVMSDCVCKRNRLTDTLWFSH